MRIYHGSDTIVQSPSLEFSRPNVDFGPGFYCTSIQEQAMRWARRVALRSGNSPILNIYDLDEDLSHLKVLQFKENDRKWLEFVCGCRNGKAIPKGFDLIIGGVANDDVFRSVGMYINGLWDADTTLRALAFVERCDQYCFATETVLRSLSFVSKEVLT